MDLSKLADKTVEYSKIAFEWPQFNDLWKNKQVKSWLASAKLQEVCFNGCMVGVVSKRGKPISKPWKVVTNCDEIVEAFSKKKAKRVKVLARVVKVSMTKPAVVTLRELGHTPYR